MEKPLKEIQYKGYTIKIWSDTDAQSPEGWDNTDCFLIHEHRQFNVEVDGFEVDEVYETWKQGKNFVSGKESYRIHPVFAYIHSGVALSLSKEEYPFTCRFDTSFAGFVLVKIQKGWSFRKEKSVKIAESVVEEWNDYLSGNVYVYEVVNKDNEYVDGCGGYYGDIDKNGIISDAQSSIDSEISKKYSKWFKQLKIFVKHSVPLAVRQKKLQEFGFCF